MNEISLRQALDYEIKSSRWLGFVSCGFIQDIIASHMARKTIAKHMRYLNRIQPGKRRHVSNGS